MNDYLDIKELIERGIDLTQRIERFLANDPDPIMYGITEAIIEAVARAGDMVAVTKDDLPKEDSE